MKFSPLILFLLIISVLLISLLFSRYLPIEGFIDFNYSDANKNAIGLPDNTIIPMYSPYRRLVRLYDNLYFDCKNAYIIFDDYEAVKQCIDTWINENTLEHIETPGCLWTNIITKLK